jgi:hypothetical protein
VQEWVISYQSALEFWRNTPAAKILSSKKLRAGKLVAKPPDVVALLKAEIGDFSFPLDVLVGEVNARRATPNINSHVSAHWFPHGSFNKVSDDLVVSSPELCFVQMANSLSQVELIALGFEFCGSYRLDKKSEDVRGFRNDAPLTNAHSLRTYVTRTAGFNGHKKAQRALRYIADGSASPMETVLTMLLALPYKSGGYGFTLPTLNYPIYSVKKPGSALVTSKPRYYCDLYWPVERVDVEYDSDAYHARPDWIARDAMRRNALVSMGITVLTVSRQQIINADKMHEVAQTLGKLLDKRLKLPKADFGAHCRELREQLLPKKSMFEQ